MNDTNRSGTNQLIYALKSNFSKAKNDIYTKSGYRELSLSDRENYTKTMNTYKRNNSIEWNRFKSQYGDTPDAEIAFANKIEATERGRVQGFTTSTTSPDHAIGGNVVKNLVYDSAKASFYPYSNGSVETTSSKKMSDIGEVQKYRFVKWNPTTNNGLVVFTNKEGADFAVNTLDLSDDVQVLVHTVGTANDLALSIDDASYKPRKADPQKNIYVQKLRNGNSYGYAVGKMGPDGKLVKPKVYQSLEDLNYDYENKFASHTNIQGLGYKKNNVTQEDVAGEIFNN